MAEIRIAMGAADNPEGPLRGDKTKIEVRSCGSGWIDMSDVCRKIKIVGEVGAFVTATLEVFPSAVVVDGQPLLEVLTDPVVVGPIDVAQEDD